MISFKEYILEVLTNSNILYHGTNFKAGIDILRDNFLASNTRYYTTFDKIDKPGISLSRNMKTSLRFSKKGNPSGKSGWILELDRDSIMNNHKILKYDYFAQNFKKDIHSGKVDRDWRGRSQEYEEIIIGGLPNLYKHIIKFYYTGSPNEIDLDKLLSYISKGAPWHSKFGGFLGN